MKLRFHNCAAKRRAREATILRPYRSLTGLRSIPESRQYITLCGPLFGPGGSVPDPASEFRHMLAEDFVTAPQFLGVEFKRSVHEANARVVAGLPPEDRPVLIHGDIRRVVENLSTSGKLRPAVINLDTQFGPENAVRTLCSILETLNDCEDRGFVLVVLNMIVEDRRFGRAHTADVLVHALKEPRCLGLLRSGGWRDAHAAYEYASAGSSCRMLTSHVCRPEQRLAGAV